jgi:primosomal protein N'
MHLYQYAMRVGIKLSVLIVKLGLWSINLNDLLICHHCGFSKKISNICVSCGNEGQIKACGPGVERIEEEIKYYFPEAELAVLSSDTMTNPKILLLILLKELKKMKLT